MQQNKRQLGIGASSTTAPARSDPSEIRSPAYKKLKAMEDAEEDASELPEDVVADIAKRIRVMKKPEIESELGKRNLDTKGIKKILAERLLEALKMELLGKKTSDDEKPPGEVDATVPKAAVMQAEPQPADEQKDSRQSVVMDDAFEETAAARISNEAESMRVSLDDDKKMAPVPEPKFSESGTDGSSDTDMQRVAENARPVDLNSKAQSPKRSRSPMQKVQQVVKMFSSAAKSPRSFHSSSKPLTGDRSPLLKSSQKSNLFGQHDKKIPEPESRPLQISKAPENGSLSTGSMSAKSGSSALKSKSGLAKNNARKERIGQWRVRLLHCCLSPPTLFVILHGDLTFFLSHFL